MTDIIDALLNHHTIIRDLMEKTSHDKKRFGELHKHLDVHHRNEELYLLNEIKEKEETRDEAWESIEEHYLINFMLNDLKYFPADDARWKIKFGILQEYTEHHLKEEEEDIFPEARKILKKQLLQELGKEFEIVRERQLAAL